MNRREIINRLYNDDDGDITFNFIRRPRLVDRFRLKWIYGKEVIDYIIGHIQDNHVTTSSDNDHPTETTRLEQFIALKEKPIQCNGITSTNPNTMSL